ncbi:hypothetical protein LEN26_007110 [Aphanomyces euteiches]|nr:hypothetical protein AeMF1_002327 [Aphanomyces euteiches]KAH9133439.1 hypothetical protein LEN26_007110 [Aphanomyces euteiches]KAH9193161.1 hypothetical protein AeNC1_004871 [Aphanomyces euteiches]
MDKLFPDDVEWTLEAVKESLKASNGEDVNARSAITGRAILHEACIRGKKDIVQYLLNHTTCDLEVRTMLGHATPLHLSAQAGERSIAFLLLSHGANATARDRFGATPLHYCTKRSVAVHLTQFGAKILTANFKRKTAAAMIQANEFADAELKAFAMELADVEYRAVRRKTQAPRS